MFLRSIAEARFKLASAEAALFELRLRALAGTIPIVQDYKIDENLAKVRDAVVAHYQSKLTAEETALLNRAVTFRNKLLHCEFSTARQHLNQIDPKARDGGVVKADIAGLDTPAMREKVTGLVSGADVGQIPVARTTTATLKNVYGWLFECQGFNEFDEAAQVFAKINQILEQLSTTALKKAGSSL